MINNPAGGFPHPARAGQTAACFLSFPRGGNWRGLGAALSAPGLALFSKPSRVSPVSHCAMTDGGASVFNDWATGSATFRDCNVRHTHPGGFCLCRPAGRRPLSWWRRKRK